MTDELKRIINRLEDEEMKSLLLQIFLRMQIVEERRGYSEHQFYSDIKNTYNDLLEHEKNQGTIVQPVQFHTTHIVFGDSPAGSLKVALKESGLDQQEKIITFSDIFQ